MEGDDEDQMNATTGGARGTGFGATTSSYYQSAGGYATNKTGMTDRRKIEI